MPESEDRVEVAKTDKSGKMHESNARLVREGENFPGTERKGSIETNESGQPNDILVNFGSTPPRTARAPRIVANTISQRDHTHTRA